MTNLGTVVYTGTLYGLDVCYIALSCASMTLLELQLLTTYHNDHIWLSRTVQGCLYATTFQGGTWQYGTFMHTIYTLYVCYIALSCASMTPLELQLLTTYHNDHIWLSRTVQRCIYAISSSDMTDGDSLGQCICRLWYDITSQSSRGNIWLPTQTVLPVSNAYMVPLHVPCCRSKWNVGISRRPNFYIN